MTSVGNALRVRIPFPSLGFHTSRDHHPVPLAHEASEEKHCSLLGSSPKAPVQEFVLEYKICVLISNKIAILGDKIITNLLVEKLGIIVISHPLIHYALD